jgi:hypothetical protein
MRDAKLAVETGVDGLDVVIGTSSFLREHSHGKDMAYIEKTAIEVIEYIKSKGLEVRCESIPLFSPATTDIHPRGCRGDTPEVSEISPRAAMLTNRSLQRGLLPVRPRRPPVSVQGSRQGRRQPCRHRRYRRLRFSQTGLRRMCYLAIFEACLLTRFRQLVRTLRGIVCTFVGSGEPAFY